MGSGVAGRNQAAFLRMPTVATGNRGDNDGLSGTEPATLVIRNRDSGFFSNFNAVVDCLVHRVGRAGVAAVRVDWRAPERHSQFPYGTEADGNLWDAFFEPLSFPSFPARTVETDTFMNFAMTGRNAYGFYKLRRGWRQQYHRAYSKYVRPKSRILDKVERIHWSGLDGHYCVGAHWRHSDHDSENLFRIPDPEVFIARLRKLLPGDRSWRVFLATDNQAAVSAFEGAFGDRLVVQPGVSRAEGRSETQFHHGHSDPSTALGEEVLVDCLLLARCDALLHVTTNIATAVGYINPDLKMIYCEAPYQAAIGYLWAIGRTAGAIFRHRLRILLEHKRAYD